MSRSSVLSPVTQRNKFAISLCTGVHYDASADHALDVNTDYSGACRPKFAAGNARRLITGKRGRNAKVPKTRRLSATMIPNDADLMQLAKSDAAESALARSLSRARSCLMNRANLDFNSKRSANSARAHARARMPYSFIVAN